MRLRPRRLAGWSLRRRLLVVTALLVLLGLAGADVATYRTLHSYLIGRVDQQLTQMSRAAGRAVIARGPSVERLVEVGEPGAFIQIRDSSGTVLASGTLRRLDQPAPPPPTLPANLGSPSSSDGSAATASFMDAPSAAGDYRVRISSLPFAAGTLIVAVPLSDVRATLRKLLWTELGVSAAAIVLVVVAGTVLVRLGLRPLDRMADTAGEIAAGRLDRRVETADSDTEVGRLGAALNSMLSEIEHAFAQRRASEDRLRRFVADASHELRTPLTSIRGYAELFHRGAGSRPEDLARSMERIEGEAVRMSVLVEDLLLLARLDQGRPLERHRLDLAAVVDAAVDAARTVEPGRPLSARVSRPAEVVGDGHRLRQVVDNLLSNVRMHTPAGTPAAVTLRVEGAEVVLEVADQGPGLPAEAAERAFERFYRADPARSHTGAGVGLGLSIVAAIVEAHGGTVSAAAGPTGGAVFTVRLPAAGNRQPAPPAA